ncbi:hypothetical protein AVEN_4531-1 [Araneus ventricosus]|uniref:Uncharacterized protein n=1 Tax=Araneus ventricosus TaxID=182803 RepID=A0A4Y2BLJ2_ARAVE|nr:hypothetical protein AVEN_4531-1 [Araneus ventricosus]
MGLKEPQPPKYSLNDARVQAKNDCNYSLKPTELIVYLLLFWKTIVAPYVWRDCQSLTAYASALELTENSLQHVIFTSLSSKEVSLATMSWRYLSGTDAKIDRQRNDSVLVAEGKVGNG